LNRLVKDLSKIPGINIRKRISLSTRWILQVCREVLRILVRLNDVADPEGVDVGSLETVGECAGGLFADDFGEGVCV
jgi:hypothetical protein